MGNCRCAQAIDLFSALDSQVWSEFLGLLGWSPLAMYGLFCLHQGALYILFFDVYHDVTWLRRTPLYHILLLTSDVMVWV